jgi:regulator of nucleoside diphosphate kinase
MKTATRPLIVTNFDRVRLENLIRDSRSNDSEGNEYLAALRSELRRARIVEPATVPRNIVTMNSTVRLRDLDTGERETLTLVFPNEADAFEDRISVLAPIGTAIIGNRVGDVIEWNVPAGLRRLKVEAILHQPERAGDFSR